MMAGTPITIIKSVDKIRAVVVFIDFIYMIFNLWWKFKRFEILLLIDENLIINNFINFIESKEKMKKN